MVSLDHPWIWSGALPWGPCFRQPHLDPLRGHEDVPTWIPASTLCSKSPPPSSPEVSPPTALASVLGPTRAFARVQVPRNPGSDYSCEPRTFPLPIAWEASLSPGCAASLYCRNQKGLPAFGLAQWAIHSPHRGSPSLPYDTPPLNTRAPCPPSFRQGCQVWQMKIEGTRLDVNLRWMTKR